MSVTFRGFFKILQFPNSQNKFKCRPRFLTKFFFPIGTLRLRFFCNQMNCNSAKNAILHILFELYNTNRGAKNYFAMLSFFNFPVLYKCSCISCTATFIRLEIKQKYPRKPQIVKFEIQSRFAKKKLGEIINLPVIEIAVW